MCILNNIEITYFPTHSLNNTMNTMHSISRCTHHSLSVKIVSFCQYITHPLYENIHLHHLRHLKRHPLGIIQRLFDWLGTYRMLTLSVCKSSKRKRTTCKLNSLHHMTSKGITSITLRKRLQRRVGLYSRATPDEVIIGFDRC